MAHASGHTAKGNAEGGASSGKRYYTVTHQGSNPSSTSGEYLQLLVSFPTVGEATPHPQPCSGFSFPIPKNIAHTGLVSLTFLSLIVTLCLFKCPYFLVKCI